MELDLPLATDVLRRTPRVLGELMRGLPSAWSDSHEGAATWSPHQVAGHMLHVEESDWIDRTRVILEHGTSRVFEPIDREAGFHRYAGMTTEQLLQRFQERRTQNLEELHQLVTPALLARRGVHPDFGGVTLAQLLATWVVHDLNHLGQIVKTMAKQYRDAVGPWRAYLPIIDAP